MRIIILLLVLINLAFYYWASQVQSNQTYYADPQSVPGYKPIKLLSELESEAQANNIASSLANEQVTLASQAKETTSQQKCFSLGPFESEVMSDEIYDQLLNSGIQSKQRKVDERRPKSYWVYLAAHESQQAAEKTVDFLKQNNISEFYIWLDPPQKYAVSLGLFKKLQTARDKIQQVSQLGLDPQMEVRFDEFTEYWVDFNHASGQQQPEIIEQMLVENDRMLILETKCL